MKSDMRIPEDLAWGKRVTAVYLNGVKVPRSVMFDDEAGVVLSWKVNEQGHVVAGADGKPTLIEHHGIVTFDLKADGEQLVSLESHTGRIHATKHDDGTYTFAWEGDDVVSFTHELLREVDPRYCTYAAFPDTAGKRFTFGPYLLETMRSDDAHEVILARRVFT